MDARDGCCTGQSLNEHSPNMNETLASANSQLSRRKFLIRSGAVGAAGVLGASGAAGMALAQTPSPDPAGPAPTGSPAPESSPSGPPEPPRQAFKSRPEIRPPVIEISPDSTTTGELVFITPLFFPNMQSEGLMIIDQRGQLVWQRSAPGRVATSLRVDRYRGRPVLSWWEGTITAGIGDGEFVLADTRYHELARVRAVGHLTDLHELLLTPRGTAFLFARRNVDVDGMLVLDMLVQEIDVATGRLLWDWSAIEHTTIEEALLPAREGEVYDYWHANSIDIDRDDSILVSARHTSTIYKIARPSGQVVWRLGGKQSDFAIGEGAAFVAQHDARRRAGNRISLFDNAAFEDGVPNAISRGMVLTVDERAMSAELDSAYSCTPPILSSSQGNFTVARDGSAFVGWGSQPRITAHAPDGSVTFEASMPTGYMSYRSFRQPWVGSPTDQPVVAIEPSTSGGATAYVSWNGATRVDRWALLAGDGPGSLEVVARAPREGFETALEVPGTPRFVAVRALDRRGRRLADSRPTEVPET
jgi:hypothetical protein